MYLALYRKYRPSSFDEVIGQEHIIKTLRNQIKNNQIGHAYLFCGSRGTGKTSTAKIFARGINCKNPVNGSPCGECESCKLNNGNIDILEIDAASNNGVDEIRDLREKVKYPPVNGRYKVYIIDEVHMLSVNAFNALLKTLEEPPSFVVFILATTEVHKLPATILSRCMRFDFRLVAVEELVKQLEKICKESNIAYTMPALNMIARAGEGSVRDMLSVADRCISFCGNNLTVEGVAEVLGVASKDSLCEICENVFSGNFGDMLCSLDKVLCQGKSPLVLARDLIAYYIDLLYICNLKEKAKEFVVANEELFAKMEKQASSENYDKILAGIEVLSGVEAELRYSVQPRIVLECALIKVMNNDNLNLRIKTLEQKMQNGANFNEKAIKNTEFSANSSKFNDIPLNGDYANNASKVEINKDSVVGNSRESNQDNLRKVTEREESVKPKSAQASSMEVQILGDLLQELRKEKALSLVAAIGQVKKVSVVGSCVEFALEDDIAVDMISASKNKKIIDRFFEERGLSFKFVSMDKANTSESDINSLSKLLGGKLKIDN